MNVALQELIDDPVLGIDERAAQWLTTAFLLTMATVIPVTGWLMERFRMRSLFVTAMGLFSLGTLLAALAPSFAVLLAGRVVQASGTAIVFPLLMTTVMGIVHPSHRGAVMGVISMVISVAPATGPVISGLILQFFGWRFVFAFMLPIAVTMLLIGARRLVQTTELSRPRLDALSVPLAALGFGGIVFALSQLGASSAPAWALPVSASVGLAAMVAFVLRQLRLQRADRALLDLRTFRFPLFTIAVVLMTVAMAAMFGTLIMLPLIMQQAMGLPPIAVGMLLLPGGVLTGALGPLVGRLYDRFGPRVLIVPGALLVLAALLLWTRLQADTPWGFVLATHLLMSLGFAFTFPPLFTVPLAALPERLYGHGSAIVGTAQQVGGAIGTAAFITIMATRRDALLADGAEPAAALVDGAHLAFLAASALWAVGILVALLLRKPADVVDDPAHPATPGAP